MFGSPWLLLAIVVAIGGALGYAKIEQARASHYIELSAAQDGTIKDLKGQVVARDGLVEKANGETKKANDNTAAANATIAKLAATSKRAQDVAAAALAAGAKDREEIEKRNAAELAAPRVAPEKACAAACSVLGAPL